VDKLFCSCIPCQIPPCCLCCSTSSCWPKQLQFFFPYPLFGMWHLWFQTLSVHILCRAIGKLPCSLLCTSKLALPWFGIGSGVVPIYWYFSWGIFPAKDSIIQFLFGLHCDIVYVAHKFIFGAKYHQSFMYGGNWRAASQCPCPMTVSFSKRLGTAIDSLSPWSGWGPGAVVFPILCSCLGRTHL
jgi:hypothetical protein